MGFNGIKLWFNGMLLDFMGFNWISWELMGFNGILWWFNGIQWDLMEFYGV